MTPTAATPASPPADVVDQAAVDVGVTLGTYNGKPVVVAAFATAGVTTQLQLPPKSAAQVGAAMLAAAAETDVDVTELMTAMLGKAAGAGLIAPSLGDTARIGARR